MKLDLLRWHHLNMLKVYEHFFVCSAELNTFFVLKKISSMSLISSFPMICFFRYFVQYKQLQKATGQLPDYVQYINKIKYKEEKSEKKKEYFLSYLILYMSCKLLAHPSLSTCLCAISIGLAEPCWSSTIPLITIFCCSHHISFCSSFLSYCHQCGLKHFQHHFSAPIPFGGKWVVEISKIFCAGILLCDKL